MKRLNIILILTALLLVAPFTMEGAATGYEIIELLGNKYYVYTAKKGDSMFGIARANGWDEAELQRLNPTVPSPIKKGTKIYYPVDGVTAVQAPAEEKKEEDKMLSDLRHEVKRGETIYSISRLYDIPVETIYKLNPKSRDGIKAGETLLLRKAQQKSEAVAENGEHFYTIKSGDTLYRVAEENGVSVAAIMQCNPGISEKNFKYDTVIKIPARGTGIEIVKTEVEATQLNSFTTHCVADGETWNSIARKEGVDVELLKQANSHVEKLKKKQILIIPKVETVTLSQTTESEDPRELTKEGIRDIYEDVHNVIDAKPEEVVIKIAILADQPTSNKDLEFIRGFLTGIDELKFKPYKINFKVIDGSKSQEVIESQLNEFAPLMVFITHDKEVPEYISKYASDHKTLVVNTFDVKSEEYTTNPYFIQFLTPSNYFNQSIANNVYQKYSSYRLILIGEEDAKDQLAQELKEIWPISNVSSYVTLTADAYSSSDSDKCIFYSYSTKKAEVKKTLEEVIAIRQEAPLADYVVLGRPNWVVYDTALKESLHQANTIIPSRFYIDDKSGSAEQFQTSFKEIFNRTPIKSHPLYAGVGYDMATYFIPAMAGAKGDINAISPSCSTLQSEIDLKRVSNWGGFINPPVYLVHFTTYGTVDKIVIE
ncbi:MAG: LysM peptidoglycan-binding domain-containing protein [Lepagella sp.]